MKKGEAGKESPGMLPTAVTAEAPTACGVGGTPAPAAGRPRRETTGSGNGSALTKPKKAAADIKKPVTLAEAATFTTTAVVEAARTAETMQVDLGATALLAGATVLVSPSPSRQTQPLEEDAANTGPTGTPSASPAAGTQRDFSSHFRSAGTFLIHCAPRPLNYFLLFCKRRQTQKPQRGVVFPVPTCRY